MAGVRYEERREACETLQEGEPVVLEREPDNRHDKNAILVIKTDGSDLGYVPRDDASDMAPLIDAGAVYQATVKTLLHTHDGIVLPVVVSVLRWEQVPESAPPQPVSRPDDEVPESAPAPPISRPDDEVSELPSEQPRFRAGPPSQIEIPGVPTPKMIAELAAQTEQAKSSRGRLTSLLVFCAAALILIVIWLLF